MHFVKPENALKRAEEFIEVGKKEKALDTLFDVIRSKKHRTWMKIHEPIMKKYLSLCVELKESHMAKDGLHQYKTITQNINVKSLEDVIVGYLTLAEEKAEKAKKEASDSNLLEDVDDLENLNSPESILLKAVSGESSQDRADRDLLAPWLKFVWESYKQCLELLKNNNKLETLYQQVAKQAFTFCFKYQRKTEFRKLCETIRQHMVQSQKYQQQATSIDLSKPETQAIHLETRLIQLNHAITMELWQEAYKAVEDIYGLMSLSKTKPRPSHMYNYYRKLSLIFWKAGNHLFHAATLQKLFVLLKEQKKTITNDELTKISTQLLLSTLAIPIPPNRTAIDECMDQDDVTAYKIKRLSSLLNLPQPPTRLSLIRDLTKYNVMQYVHPELRDLYKWLEVEFHPLKLSQRVTKCISVIENNKEIATENAQYVSAIKDITMTRLLKQISQVYTSIEIARFVKLAPSGIDLNTLEKLIVYSTKHLDLQVRVNHQTQSLHFGNDLYVAQKEDMPEGPTIQSMPSEQIRNQLVTMSEALQQAQELIYKHENKASRDVMAQTIATVYKQTCDKHHSDLLRRKATIEDKIERLKIMQQEKREYEKNQIREKQTVITAKSGDYRDSYMSNLNEHRANALLDDERDRNANNDEQNRKQAELLNKEKRELAERLKKEEKKFDYFVRACHENEIPLINELAKEDAVIRKKFWEKKELERIENLKREQQIQAENRDRLMRMNTDKSKFEQLIFDARKEEFEKKKAEFEVKLKSAREAKLLERKEQRKQDRRNAHLKEIEDKKRREEEEKRRIEEEEIRRKQNEQYEKQRQREREVEEKLSRQHLVEKRDPDQRDQQGGGGGGGGVYKPRSAGGSGFKGPERGGNDPDSESSWRRQGGGGRDDSDRFDRGNRDRDGDDRRQRPTFNRDQDRGGESAWRVRSDEKENDGGSGKYQPPGRRGIMDDDRSGGGMRRDNHSGNFERGGFNRGDRGGGDRSMGGPSQRGGRYGGDSRSDDVWRRGNDDKSERSGPPSDRRKPENSEEPGWVVKGKK